ncbi:MAG: GatB/YqeY domain-containing protein [Candidatus Absconditabacterales bacterium]
MSLLQKLTEDYKQAMRDKNEIKKSALNFVLSQIKYKKIELQKEPEDEDVVGVIKKELKTIAETIGFLEKANKLEDLEIEKQKKEFLTSYLPEVLDKEKTKEIIENIIKKLGISDLKTQRGMMMKEIMAEYKGKIDGGLVNEIVNEMISK